MTNHHARHIPLLLIFAVCSTIWQRLNCAIWRAHDPTRFDLPAQQRDWNSILIVAQHTIFDKSNRMPLPYESSNSWSIFSKLTMQIYYVDNELLHTLSTISLLAPESKSRLTMSVWRWSAANISAVNPSWVWPIDRRFEIINIRPRSLTKNSMPRHWP